LALLPPALVSSRLVAAMSHPTRFHAMTTLVEEAATPAQIAEKIGEPLNNVTYHIKVLTELGCVELVRVQPARGGRVVEHLYRATQRAYLDAAAWDELSEKEKLQVDNALMRLISEDIADAMSHGTFFEDDDNHVSRMPMILDKDGWGEVVSLLERTLNRLMEIQERVNFRSADPSETTLAKVEIIHFRSPPPKKA
jgi:DNA-binding transcriptional ArsR family regulator